MSKIICHIDLNTFFVRCEELKNPSLEGKPVIIGHRGRAGIVSTSSYEARKFGVKSGMPMYKALLLCPNAVVIDGHYEDYVGKSREFIDYVKRFTKKIEQMSIDECFADFTEVLKNNRDPKGFFRNFQVNLLKETGLKCSIGIAPTKFLAKMASDMKKPLGLTIIRRRDVRKMIDPLPIEDFFGIGKKTAPRLKEIGIKTIGDLATLVNSEDENIKVLLGKFYYSIKDWINGYGSDEINTDEFDPKSIGHSTTFIQDTDNPEEIKPYLYKLSKEVSQDAISKDKVGTTIQIVLKDSEFKVINRSKTLEKSTNDEKIIYVVACELLEKNFNGHMTRLCGITLQNLKNPKEEIQQMSIFDNFEDIKEECATKLLIAELNRKMHGSVFKTAADHLKELKNGTK